MTTDAARISLDGPMSLRDTLESGQAFRWRRTTSEDFGDHYEGVVFGNLVRVRQDGDSLLFTSHPDPSSAIKPLLADYLGLGHDLAEICTGLESDEVVGDSIRRYPGMRILRQEPWECLTSFICSANNNIPRISKNVEDIASAFGDRIPGAGSDRRAFPGADAIAWAGETALRELGLGFRAKYLAASSERVAAGEVDLFAQRETTYDEALKTMCGLDGVGDKVANCVLLFSMDKMEAFPVDVWIDRALREWYFTDGESKKMPRTRMREWAQARFGRYAGYANQYLFHSARLQATTKSRSS